MKAERIYGIFKGELLLNLRFKWRFLLEALFRLRASFLFFFMYYGFFQGGARGIGDVTRQNYVVFLLLGLIIFSVFTQGFNAPSRSFLEKKWWGALPGLFASPVTTMDLLVGIGLAALVEVAPLILLSIALSWFVMPVAIQTILSLLLVLAIMYIGVLGLGILRAAFVITNENVEAWFNIAYWAAIALSCFYYPIESLPPLLHPVVHLNPFYHANVVGKAVWLGSPYSPWSVAYVAVMGVVFATGGAYFFRRICERTGIQG
jgi:ABC-type polysaccharide/polyol phosphate export permease